MNQQEFVIGGYSDPHGSRDGFGALLIGVYRRDRLLYAGKVGTGFDDEMLLRLKAQLQRLERDTTPFEGTRLPSGGIHSVTPSLVAEIGFEEWTAEGELRHPRFLGVRRDTDAEDVVHEEPSL